MALLERVTTLIKANINSLIEKAENPEKLLKQLLLDMQNQFLQVKTQVAGALAHEHLLQKKHAETLASQRDWVRKAELALQKGEEALARGALERSILFETAARDFERQLTEQTHHVQMLNDLMQALEQKMTETKLKADLLIAQHRRAKLVQKAAQAGFTPDEAVDERAPTKVDEAEAAAHGQIAVAQIGMERQLDALAKTDPVDRLLEEMKQRHARAIGPAR